MELIACGLNHKTAPIALRERYALAHDALRDMAFAPDNNADELAVLSTCNRSEIYCASNEPSAVLTWLRDKQNISSADFKNHFYVLRNEKMIQHMARVACGLDSMTVGEPQIFGQMKEAYLKAQEAGTVGSVLHSVFQRVFAISKRIRTHTDIARSAVSIAYLGVERIQQVFTDLSEARVLLIGAGETIELVAKHLKRRGAQHFLIANRTIANAACLTQSIGGKAITIGQIPEAVSKVDIIISATACPIAIIGKGMVEHTLNCRKRPLFLMDLAVPRDIEPEIATLGDDVHLYNIDDLKSLADKHMSARHHAAQMAEQLVELEVDEFVRKKRMLEATTLITDYRNTIQTLQSNELNRAKQALRQGEDPEEVLSQFAHRLASKIMHHPTTEIRQAMANGREEVLLFAHRLLGLNALHE